MKTLMIVAHPDDEVIFGWPVLMHSEDEVSLLVLSDNRERYGCGPTDAMREIAELNQVKHARIFRVETNFYRLPTRNATLTLRQVTDRLLVGMREMVSLVQPDAIFTHNPMGEYGHGDHRCVFNLAMMLGLPMRMTDICSYNACHVSSNSRPRFWERLYAHADGDRECRLDEAWYNSMKRVYEKHKAWSWSGHEPVRRCKLFLF